jgi:hypothetical protein
MDYGPSLAELYVYCPESAAQDRFTVRDSMDADAREVIDNDTGARRLVPVLLANEIGLEAAFGACLLSDKPFLEAETKGEDHASPPDPSPQG